MMVVSNGFTAGTAIAGFVAAWMLPRWVVSAVAPAPGGAKPSYAQGYYARDNAFYSQWDKIARERDGFTAWMQANVMRREGAHA